MFQASSNISQASQRVHTTTQRGKKRKAAASASVSQSRKKKPTETQQVIFVETFF